MKWFERHLNWSAIFITLGGAIFTCLAFFMALGFNLLESFSWLSTEYRACLAVAVFFAGLVSFLCMAWIIRNKQRNPAFLIFFIPTTLFFLLLVLVLFPGLNFRYIWHYANVYLPVFLYLFFSFVFWVVGLVIIILLKKKTPILQTGNASPPTLAQHRPFGFIRVTGALALIALIVAGISGAGINSGSQALAYEQQNPRKDAAFHYSKFTFECPESYYPFRGRNVLFFQRNVEEIGLQRHRIKPFGVESTIIQVSITLALPGKGSPADSTLIEQLVSNYTSQTGFLATNTRNQHLTLKKTVVNGNIADYAGFLTFEPATPFVDGPGKWNEVKMVCFEREGIIWTITMEKSNADTISSDSDFEHFIKSFRIYE